MIGKLICKDFETGCQTEDFVKCRENSFPFMNTQMSDFSCDAQGHFQKAVQAAGSGVTGKPGRVGPGGSPTPSPRLRQGPLTQALPTPRGLFL